MLPSAIILLPLCCHLADIDYALQAAFAIFAISATDFLSLLRQASMMPPLQAAMPGFSLMPLPFSCHR
jgi:hypothetical protein